MSVQEKEITLLLESNYFFVGVLMGFLLDICPIQFINSKSVFEYSVAFILVLFILLLLTSLKYGFYSPKVRLLNIGIWVGTFIVATFQIFSWLLGSWELISSTYSIILSLYFSALFQLIEAIHKQDLEELV